MNKDFNYGEKKQNQLGRPRLKIDINILANLAQIGCPDYEIAKILNISKDYERIMTKALKAFKKSKLDYLLLDEYLVYR